jgi:uncharacterized protein (TIGR03083 family)
MQPLSPERYYAAIEAATCRLATLVADGDLSRVIPACPDWNLRQLATHVGRAQRWAAEIVTTRSAEFIPFRSVPDGRFPDDPAQHAAWVTAGGRRVIDAVRSAGEARVWAFDGTGPAGFWARRMTHETGVHAADAEAAFGRQPEIAPDLAADGIDEWLGLLASRRYQPAEPPGPPLAEGQVLHVHATGTGPDGTRSEGTVSEGTGEWLVSVTGSGIAVRAGHGRADVALAGPASRVLLVLLRRLPPDDPAVQVHGDAGLLGQWLARTPF